MNEIDEAVAYGLRCADRIKRGEWLNAPATVAATLAAEVRRYQLMRCETCKFMERGAFDSHVCRMVGNLEGTGYAQSTDLGGGCLAWEKR